MNSYCKSLTKYSRRVSREVFIGEIPMGGGNPIRIQSMTTPDTMDTQASVEQILRMVESGCEYVRLTAPSIKEAENLAQIKKELRKRGCQVPLVADIHFTPNAAEVAAKIVEKVRINPGNYADKKRFETIDYTDEAYQAELGRIKKRFKPLVEICKEYGTAMRIGTNHGSLSDRILSRYGDTPLGMVESALEFVRICEEMDYYDLVISMKASNTQVMVQAYRLLVNKLEEEGLQPYPLHLGVTEAGEGEDGRIKSAVGIGTLLEDGLGDTVRVSLTEEPEKEAPVAKLLIDRYKNRTAHEEIPPIFTNPVDPFHYARRKSREVLNIGGNNVPRVITDLSHISSLTEKNLKSVGHFYLPELDKWKMNDLGCDYIYTGNQPVDFMLPNGLKELINFKSWKNSDDKENKFPVFQPEELLEGYEKHHSLNFLLLDAGNFHQAIWEVIKRDPSLVVLLDTHNKHAMPAQRRLFFELMIEELTVPVVIVRKFGKLSEDQLQIDAATDIGGLLIDGFGDGVMLSTEHLVKEQSKTEQLQQVKVYNNLSFGILQAARTRMSKTEYISCPSCGRTLFDLQETTAMIRKRTDHLKGVKIGIMGCIVNGPGEMADADYGYVGSGKGKITLYRGQEVVKRNVASENAVDELIEIIREDDNWTEPEAVE
ncbi:4-hydroxy-3-methylbut-2-en-1-yl diphosphate synthase [Cytophagales bacterium RKSG123]|nr:4-hydroxy-3-methylbut-2-en-1-yl diphosphate synthase [Xanthovirga aplysinae]